MIRISGEEMSEKSPEEKAEERASLWRQGAGNYSNLCGVLAGFVAVIMVLVLTPGFFPKAEKSVLFELMIIFFTISAFGYIVTAIFFANISATPLWHYKSLGDMGKDYVFSQVLVFLFTLFFLGGVAVLNLSMGTFFVAIVVVVGLLFVASEVIRNWWALAKRPPPRKKK